MTDEYNDGQPEAVIPPEVVVDDPKRPWKAYVPTILTTVAAFGYQWIADDDPFTAKEAVGAALAALATGGFIGGATFFTPNPKKVVTS